jgi:hypothetical protein
MVEKLIVVGDPDNIIVPDGDYPLKDRPKPAKKGSISFSEWKKMQKEPSAPQDRGSDSARRPNMARHAKTGNPVYGEYPATPTGPAMGGKHGKSWNGKD